MSSQVTADEPTQVPRRTPRWYLHLIRAPVNMMLNLNSLQVPFPRPIKLVWLFLHKVWKSKKKKKTYFTHEQAIVFRFKMSLQNHRKHCSWVSYRSMKCPLPSGAGVVVERSHLAEALSALSCHPPSCSGLYRAHYMCIPPPSGPSHSNRCSKLYLLWALQPFYTTKLYTPAELILCTWSTHSTQKALQICLLDEWMDG